MTDTVRRMNSARTGDADPGVAAPRETIRQRRDDLVKHRG